VKAKACDLTYSEFYDCSLNQCDFEAVNLKEVKFERSKLSNIDLSLIKPYKIQNEKPKFNDCILNNIVSDKYIVTDSKTKVIQTQTIGNDSFYLFFVFLCLKMYAVTTHLKFNDIF